MAKLKIYTFPDEVLSKKAAPVQEIGEDIKKLAEDMLETMYSANGIGLAANQVGILQRILVLDVESEEADIEADLRGEERPENAELKPGRPIVIINPEIVQAEGTILFTEGCLSVPEFTEEVKRSEKIKLDYLDIDGNKQSLDAEGLLAVCIQHEIDHLNGKLFIDRLSPLKKEMVKKQLLKERAERDQLESGR